MLGDPEVSRTCYIATLKGKEKLVAQTAYLEPWEPTEKEERLETDLPGATRSHGQDWLLPVRANAEGIRITPRGIRRDFRVEC